MHTEQAVTKVEFWTPESQRSVVLPDADLVLLLDKLVLIGISEAVAREMIALLAQSYDTEVTSVTMDSSECYVQAPPLPCAAISA